MSLGCQTRLAALNFSLYVLGMRWEAESDRDASARGNVFRPQFLQNILNAGTLICDPIIQTEHSALVIQRKLFYSAVWTVDIYLIKWTFETRDLRGGVSPPSCEMVIAEEFWRERT